MSENNAKKFKLVTLNSRSGDDYDKHILAPSDMSDHEIESKVSETIDKMDGDCEFWDWDDLQDELVALNVGFVKIEETYTTERSWD